MYRGYIHQFNCLLAKSSYTNFFLIKWEDILLDVQSPSLHCKCICKVQLVVNYFWKQFSLYQVPKGEPVPIVSKSIKGKDFISTNSGLNFLDKSSTLTKAGLRHLSFIPSSTLWVFKWECLTVKGNFSIAEKTSEYFRTVMFHFVAILKTDDDPLQFTAEAIPSIFKLRFWG